MLTVDYSLLSGEHSDVPDAPHILKLTDMDRLSLNEQAMLRRFIVRKKMNVTLTEEITVIIGGRTETLEMIKLLDQFRRSIENERPSILQILAGWSVILMMFIFPIYVAYHLSSYIESSLAMPVVEWASEAFQGFPSAIDTMLFGQFGIISLGAYSLVWALPIVILIGISTTFIDQTNMKGRIVWMIGPSMKRIGLDGSDIIPVIEGFGCNAAAVINAANACGSCTKTRCISLIAFGASCSYQIGATLSIFSAAGKPFLFFPYLLLVFIGGIVHNKLWLKNEGVSPGILNAEALKMPNVGQFARQVYGIVHMFLTQALPIFILICITASLLTLTSVLDWIAVIFEPILYWLGVPAEAATGVLFSIIRKDGILIFNMDNGALIQSISTGSLFLIVFFSSTFTACSITLTMITKYFGLAESFKIATRQMVTSLACIVAGGLLIHIVQLIH